MCVLVQAAVGLEGMADGAVLSGIPRSMALKFSAHAVMVGFYDKNAIKLCFWEILLYRVLLDW